MIPADSLRTGMRVMRTAEATVTLLLDKSLNAIVNINRTHIDLGMRLLSRIIVMVASAVLITLMPVRRESPGIIINLLLCAFMFISLSAPRLCPPHP